MKLNYMKNVYCGHNDVNGKRIYFETSVLFLPNGLAARLGFDYGQLKAYFANDIDLCAIVELTGVNTSKSFYLDHCIVAAQE